MASTLSRCWFLPLPLLSPVDVPSNSIDALIPEVGLPLVPSVSPIRRTCPAPLALRSEGTSKPDPKAHEGVQTARWPGLLWLAWFQGSRMFYRKNPFTLLLSGGNSSHSDVLCQALLAVARVPSCPSHPSRALSSAGSADGWKAEKDSLGPQGLW